MQKLTVEIPEDLVEAIRLPREEIPSRLKKELAVRLYEKGLLRRYDLQELQKDLETLEELG